MQPALRLCVELVLSTSGVNSAEVELSCMCFNVDVQ